MRFFIFLLVIVFIGWVLNRHFQAPRYSGPLSDHFDGHRFFNLDGPAKQKSFKTILKWWIFSGRVPWQTWIEIDDSFVPPKKISEPNKASITFVNHSTLLIQGGGLSLLTDPVWSDRLGPAQWLTGPKRHHAPGIRFENLPSIDAVLVSHNHYDHMDIPTLKRLHSLNPRPQFFSGLGTQDLLKKHGNYSSRDLDWWQEYVLNDQVKISFLPAQHWSLRAFGDFAHTLWGSFLIEIDKLKIYFAGDTGMGPHFEKITERFGPMDLCLLPIGAYQPQWIMKENHIAPWEAVEVHQQMKCKKSIAIHYGTFQNSDEGREQPVIDLQQALKEKGVTPETFIMLPPGKSLELSQNG